ncbi:MAG: DUF2264 domain-containing protein [Lachnospiraceae bacterium]|nr:DUF2264 domain-containing protein [Lachnospiraceae bacterium]
MVQLLLDWIRPLKGHYSKGGAQLIIGNTSAHYGETSIRMEGFSRVLWGLAPLFSRSVESLIIPQEKGHIRIHHTKTKEDIGLADGGFSIRVEDGINRMDTSMVQTTERAVRCHFPWGNAGAENLEGDGEQNQE